jgi:hypothetical protein
MLDTNEKISDREKLMHRDKQTDHEQPVKYVHRKKMTTAKKTFR